MNSIPISAWLPTTRDEIESRGQDEVDVVLITGDAYIDHPSMGAAVVARIIESHGFKVAILAQPNWRDDLRDFKKLGKPRLCFAITAGNMDSMVNHYTAHKRLRSDDAYTPGGKAGFRPDRASIVYSQIVKELYPDVPVILGGIEASMRRLTHFDYWENRLRPSILVDSKADLLVYGMGEQPLREMLTLLKKGVPFSSLTTIPQTAYLSRDIPKHKHWETKTLRSHAECVAKASFFLENEVAIEKESIRFEGHTRLIQAVDDGIVIVNPAYPPMSTSDLDASFELPYTRLPHPKYKKRGAIPAYEMIRFSVNIHRGCFGACSFCAIAAHQGKFIVSRSEDSILRELDAVAELPDFKGRLSDLGGPSANMYGMSGIDITKCHACARPSCIHPLICGNLNSSHDRLLKLYNRVMKHPAIQHVTIGSGLRHDLMLKKEDTSYIEALVTRHVSGRLKLAPEHSEDHVLALMRKPAFSAFERFHDLFHEVNAKHGLKQQLVPYFISSHPGCTLGDMKKLSTRVKKLKVHLEPVQDFTPTPMTRSTAMYWTGVVPETGKPIPVSRQLDEKREQKQSFFKPTPTTTRSPHRHHHK